MRKKRPKRHHKKRRGVYLLPNLITSASLFCGFYSAISTISGNFHQAAILILLSAVFDGLDGRIARLTKATSRFGVEYDSLADLVAFGVAPALLMYYWGLEALGRLGWVTAFIFCICGALRLARFNTQTDDGHHKDYFTGLPIPGAAGMIASLVVFFSHFKVDMSSFSIPLFVFTNLLAFLMVSTIKYPAFKSINLMGARSFQVLVMCILLLLPLLYHPQLVLMITLGSYIFLGPFYDLIKRLFFEHGEEWEEKGIKAPENEVEAKMDIKGHI